MMLKLIMVGRCTDCGVEVAGCKLAWPKRVNLKSIIIENSICYFEKCGCDPSQAASDMDVLSIWMATESKAAVEAARDRIRARRKKTAA